MGGGWEEAKDDKSGADITVVVCFDLAFKNKIKCFFFFTLQKVRKVHKKCVLFYIESLSFALINLRKIVGIASL